MLQSVAYRFCKLVKSYRETLYLNFSCSVLLTQIKGAVRMRISMHLLSTFMPLYLKLTSNTTSTYIIYSSISDLYNKNFTTKSTKILKRKKKTRNKNKNKSMSLTWCQILNLKLKDSNFFSKREGAWMPVQNLKLNYKWFERY